MCSLRRDCALGVTSLSVNWKLLRVPPVFIHERVDCQGCHDIVLLWCTIFVSCAILYIHCSPTLIILSLVVRNDLFVFSKQSYME